jgi:hypothetical protein
MSSYYEKDLTQFTLLSLPNRYGRVVVGDSQGNIFTVSTKKWQEIVDWKIFTTAVPGGKLRQPRSWHTEIIVLARQQQMWRRSLIIHVWGEPLLGLGVICAWDGLDEQWVLWTPMPQILPCSFGPAQE